MCGGISSRVDSGRIKGIRAAEAKDAKWKTTEASATRLLWQCLFPSHEAGRCRRTFKILVNRWDAKNCCTVEIDVFSLPNNGTKFRFEASLKLNPSGERNFSEVLRKTIICFEIRSVVAYLWFRSPLIRGNSPGRSVLIFL